MKKHVKIYTDGACKGNPGPGGWGAILVYLGVEKVISGGERETTNNRMELLAVINALECLKEPCKITLVSDSSYVINGLEKGWALGWKKNDKPSKFAPGKMLGKDVYKNDDRKLPVKPGRIWYEADINYVEGYRGPSRILYSNDGLIFVTYDHYKTFYEVTR